MNQRKSTIAAAVAVLAVAAFAYGWLRGGDPAVAELQQMAGQMFDRDLPDAQRDQLRDEFRHRMSSLSDDQRRAFFEASRGQWMSRAEQRMDEFFTSPPAEQRQQLDEMLDRMMQPRPDRRGDDRDRGDWSGRRGSMTEAQRDERSKRRLDRTSPKLRAQFTEFRRRLEDRAKERGIDPGSLPGRPWPSGRRA